VNAWSQNPAPMKPRIRRWVSTALLALLAFTQASLVLAGCAMDRAELAQMLTQPGGHDCCDESGASTGFDALPMSANECVAHSTADLQASGGPLPIFLAIADLPVLHLPVDRPPATPRKPAPPRERVPSRILLHSFLI